MQNNQKKQYLNFTKKEKLGTLVVLAGVFIIFICAKYIYPLVIKDAAPDPREMNAGVDSLKEKQNAGNENYYAQNKNTSSDRDEESYQRPGNDKGFSGELFYFDPNKLDAAGWKKLGVKEKTIATIQNYLSKGGKFREPDDLRKVWGLRDDEKDRLIPYVRITEQVPPAGGYTNNYKSYENKPYEKKAIASVDINSGDSAAFDGLPGIGPGFSRRIINFRNRLGGFYKVDQVAETFGLPDSVFQKIKPLLKISGNNIRKININTATNDELKAHPYIRWQLAKVIMEYKAQHGNFKSIEDLKKIMLINEETYNKISSYLSL